jgi:PAS domain S-box-containing protein
LILTLSIVPLSVRAGLQLRSKEQLVAKSRNRFEQMAKQLTSGIAILEGEHLVFYNRRLGEFLDLPEPGDDGQPGELVQNRMQAFLGQVAEAEVLMTDPDGGSVRGCSIPDGPGGQRYVVVRSTLDQEARVTYVVVSDWTQRRLYRQELDLLSNIIRDCPLSVIVTDTQGNIQYANPFASTSSGYAREELIGSNPRVLKSNNVPAAVYKDMWDTILAGKPWQGELLNRSKSGQDYWESIIAAPLMDNQGCIQRLYAIKQDITSRKKMERELVDARRKAEESDRIKSAFLNNISHEIRTPLNAICGFLYLIDDEIQSNPDLADFSETIRENTDALVGLVDDILKMSELEASKCFNNYEQYHLDDLLRESLSTARYRAGSNVSPQVTFQTDFDPTLTEKVVFTDKEKITAIFNELISNAIKFTKDGTIVIGYRMKAGELSFWVSDTGIGIPEDEQPRIFKLFYHGEKNFVSLHNGTGLGLNIVKKLTQQMGGSISLQSMVGVGTTVTIEGICGLDASKTQGAAGHDFCPVV